MWSVTPPGRQKHCHYGKLLSVLEAQKRYLTKLDLVGLSLKEDPYSSEIDKLFSKMSSWPRLEYGHIYMYFISRPGLLHTHKQLLSWKQLEAYNHFKSGQ